MRSKEDAHDYRYFPEPDLVPFTVSEAEIEREREKLSKIEMPEKKKERYMADYKLTEYEVRLILADYEIAELFEKLVKIYKPTKTITMWITGAVFAYRASSDEFKLYGLSKLKPELLVQLFKLVDEGALSFQVAKEKIFPEVMKGRNPAVVMKEEGWEQVSDDKSLVQWIADAIKDNPKVVEDFRSGKETAAMFLVGQVMKKSQSKANPGKVKDLLLAKLKEV